MSQQSHNMLIRYEHSYRYRQGREGKDESEPDLADIGDKDLEDMVEWCQDLNFDNYINHWLELATATTFPAGRLLYISRCLRFESR